LIVATVALAALALAALPAPAQRQRRPNIVVLMTDDQTLASLSVMTHTRELLGERGTTFDRAFAGFSLCCPSRATLYTGQYAHNHGVLGNAPPAGGYAKLDKSNWLPVWLQQAGYRTMHVGKFLNGYGRTGSVPTEVPPGFDDWHGTVDPSTYRFWGYTVNENGTLRTYGEDLDPAFYSTDFFTRRANELIGAAAPSSKPFFISVAFLAPHSGGPEDEDDPNNPPTPSPAPRHRGTFASTPLPQPASFNELDVTDKPANIRNRPLLTPARIAGIQENYQQRLESLLAVDEGVASIVDTLRRTGELDDTLILFTSDNGFFHGEHRVAAGKVLVYEPSIRLPLLMRGPGVPRGAHRRQLVTNADLAPTILDAADARAGRSQDGRSLFGLLEDADVEWGRELLVEGGNNQGLTFTALRNYRFVYVEWVSGERELYDLERDPDQLQSLHADPAYAPLIGALAQRLAVLRACAGRGCRARPALELRTRRRCARPRFLAAVRGAEPVERVEFYVRGRRVARDTSAPFKKLLRRRGVRPGRRFQLRARVRLGDGRVVTIDSRERACR
jgi:arylsulfatase A-like enzyme